MNEGEICQFFDVDIQQGLSKKDALARLTRFGANTDMTLPDVLLKQLNAKVYRNYCVELVSIKQVVPGDVVILEEGDRLPADVRLLQVNKLSLSQGAITGEAIASPKNTFALPEKSSFINQKCMAFAGSFVVSGTGLGVVVARGKDAAIAKIPKKRKPKVGFRQQTVAKKLQRAGVVLLNPRVLRDFSNIGAVVIDAKLSDDQIVETIRKVQLAKNILCKFIVGTDTANKLASELGVTIYDAKYPKADILNTQFIVNTDAATSVKLVSALQESGDKVLWVTDGIRSLVGSKSANVVLAVGDEGRDDVRLGADLLSIKHDASLVSKIL